MIARTQDVGGGAGKDLALKVGSKITTLESVEVERWRRTPSTVKSDVIKGMQSKSVDATRLVSEARSLISRYEKWVRWATESMALPKPTSGTGPPPGCKPTGSTRSSAEALTAPRTAHWK